LVRRALKVLSDREVSPQLGLLKSTLLQLDSTFSERDYGASTFRDFIEKLAAAGYVHLKQVDRSLLVELKDHEQHQHQQQQPVEEEEVSGNVAPREEPQPHATVHHVTQSPQSPSQIEEGVRIIQEVFQNPKINPHWPMYLRNVKQFIKNAAPTFDERKYGFASFLEAVRAAQKANVLKLERNRQGILRVYPGSLIPQPARPSIPAVVGVSQAVNEAPVDEPIVVEAEPIIEAASVQEVIDVEDVESVMDETIPVGETPTEDSGRPARKKRASGAAPARKRATAKPRSPSAPKRARKKTTEEEPQM